MLQITHDQARSAETPGTKQGMVSNNWTTTCFQQRLPVSNSPVVQIGEEEVSETVIARYDSRRERAPRLIFTPV